MTRMPAGPRRSILLAADAALDVIEDGATVGIGGAVTTGHPMALVRELARRGVRDLTIVAPIGGIEVDILIAAGCVRRVVGCYVGVEGVAGVGPVFRQAVESGAVEVADLDEAHCVIGLRAAGQRLPFLPWRGGVGTSYPELNPAVVNFQDPLRGEPLLAISAIELDFALIHAEYADQFGNMQTVGPMQMDPLLASAAREVVIEVDRVVSTERIRRAPERTRFWPRATVVHAPFGTHPYSNAWMIADEEHLRSFVSAAKSQDGELDEYLQRTIYGPSDHAGYLETVGIRRLTALLV
jgi:glutaconate CoA-transferase, subunit A